MKTVLVGMGWWTKIEINCECDQLIWLLFLSSPLPFSPFSFPCSFLSFFLLSSSTHQFIRHSPIQTPTHPSTYPSFHLSIFSSISSSIHPHTHLSTHPSFHPFPIYPSTHPSIHPPTQPHLLSLVPIFPSVHPFIHHIKIFESFFNSLQWQISFNASKKSENFHHRTLWDWTLLRHLVIKSSCWGFLGGSVVKNLPVNAGDMCSIPDPGRSHMQWSK